MVEKVWQARSANERSHRVFHDEDKVYGSRQTGGSDCSVQGRCWRVDDQDRCQGDTEGKRGNTIAFVDPIPRALYDLGMQTLLYLVLESFLRSWQSSPRFSEFPYTT